MMLILTSMFKHRLQIRLSDLLTVYTHPGSFILLQTRGYFVSPMLEQTSLFNAVTPTELQSNGIRCLLTSVTFSPPMHSKLR